MSAGTFQVEISDDSTYYYERVVYVPQKGDVVVLDRAPKGVHHLVERVVHRIGGGDHRITIHAQRIGSVENYVQSNADGGVSSDYKRMLF